jgi:hypothetical protein
VGKSGFRSGFSTIDAANVPNNPGGLDCFSPSFVFHSETGRLLEELVKEEVVRKGVEGRWGNQAEASAPTES